MNEYIYIYIYIDYRDIQSNCIKDVSKEMYIKKKEMYHIIIYPE